MGKFIRQFVFAIFLLCAAGFVFLRLGLMPVDALSAPPRWEAKLAGMFLDASVGRSAGSVENPLSPTDRNLLSGLKLYERNCEVCHGGFQKPSPVGSRSLYPRAPQFGARRLRPSAENAPPDSRVRKDSNHDAEAFWIVKNGIRYTGMPGWNKTLKDDEIWQVVTFLSHLRDLPPAVKSKWESGKP